MVEVSEQSLEEAIENAPIGEAVEGSDGASPSKETGKSCAPQDEIEALSQIIRELNERFGTDFSEEDKVFVQLLEDRLAEDPSLVASVKANTSENARLTFDHAVTDRLQDMVDTNFKFYKRLTDDKDFGKFFVGWLFERFRKGVK
jgi:type I restriction enzyme, R subunit